MEMVPLIDCMFLLLTFFIYVATTMALQRGIPIDLAQAHSGESLQRESEPIPVFIRRTGELYLKDAPVTEETLSQQLRVKARQGDPRSVVLHADEAVLHRRVVEILDLVRESGTPQVILAVEPKGSDH